MFLNGGRKPEIPGRREPTCAQGEHAMTILIIKMCFNIETLQKSVLTCSEQACLTFSYDDETELRSDFGG